ncbi:hypothetical protein L1049_006905 [Liquidambar formosana]|uniref:Uncharacterized protein n=1 Tax=Liquidambar formosana TaxID=63359 RepID=A0AAP0RHZ9_LIQFO
MGRNVEEQVILNGESKAIAEGDYQESLFASLPKSPLQNGRPNSMVVKKAHMVIPAHLIAEAISTLHGLDLRWSGPITPTERQYVQQYVFAKYPQYCNGLVEEKDQIDLYTLSINEESSDSPPYDKRKSPMSISTSPSSNYLSDLDKTQLEPSRLLDILTKKSSFQGGFISIPEIQARNRALNHCGLSEDEYLVLFSAKLQGCYDDDRRELPLF